MALHINKNRDNISEFDHNEQDTTINDFSEIVNKVYKRTLGSQLINVKPIVMKVDYSASM